MHMLGHISAVRHSLTRGLLLAVCWVCCGPNRDSSGKELCAGQKSGLLRFAVRASVSLRVSAVFSMVGSGCCCG
jgi:hypothetical protein